MPLFVPQQDPTEFEALCSSSLNVGDFVVISGSRTVDGRHNVVKADPTDYSKMPAVGIVGFKYSSTDCLIKTRGFVDATGSIPPNKTMYLSVDGTASVNPPSLGANQSVFVQVLGTTTDADQLYLEPDWVITKKVS